MKFIFFVLLLCTQVKAQDFSFLSNQGPATFLEVDQLFAPTRKLEKDDSTKVAYSNLAASHTIKNSKNAVTIGARSQALNLSASETLLNDYYNIQGSLGLRHTFEDEKFAYLGLSYGSASDKPFKNNNDSTISVNYIQKFSDRWFGVVNYSNNRIFLNNIPLPGFLWVKEMTREKTLIIGFPLIYWVTPVSEKWTFRYAGLLPWNHKLKLLYRMTPFTSPYFAYEQAPISFFRHDRDSRKDRFFWFERRLGVGVEKELAKTVRLDFMTGLAFDRQFFEARNFTEKKNYLYNIENGYFISINLKITL